MKTQCDKLLADLKNGEWVEPMGSFAKHSISPTCFHRRIGDLKDRGHDITSEWVKTENSRYKRYRMAA